VGGGQAEANCSICASALVGGRGEHSADLPSTVSRRAVGVDDIANNLPSNICLMARVSRFAQRAAYHAAYFRTAAAGTAPHAYCACVYRTRAARGGRGSCRALQQYNGGAGLIMPVDRLHLCCGACRLCAAMSRQDGPWRPGMAHMLPLPCLPLRSRGGWARRGSTGTSRLGMLPSLPTAD